jgi:hypothetical protein
MTDVVAVAFPTQFHWGEFLLIYGRAIRSSSAADEDDDNDDDDEINCCPVVFDDESGHILELQGS